MKTPSSARRLNACLAASLGAAASLPTATEAAIIYFDVNPDLQLPRETTLTFGSINLQNTTYNLVGGGFNLSIYNNYGTLRFTGGGIEVAAEDGYYAYALTGNTSIGSQYTWSLYAPNQIGDVGDNNYVGLRMDLGNGSYNYGWMSFGPVYTSNDENNLVTFTITGFAFQGTPDTPILAGAVPEPSIIHCLLLGGSAFAVSRRRRRDALAS